MHRRGRQHSFHDVASQPWIHRCREKTLSYDESHWLQTANNATYEGGLLSCFLSSHTAHPSMPHRANATGGGNIEKDEKESCSSRSPGVECECMRLKTGSFYRRVIMLLKLQCPEDGQEVNGMLMMTLSFLLVTNVQHLTCGQRMRSKPWQKYNGSHYSHFHKGPQKDWKSRHFPSSPSFCRPKCRHSSMSKLSKGLNMIGT